VSFQIKRFRIFGLHNKYDIDIPIVDNKLVLVGVNGMGKTTIFNLLYFLITEQWTRFFEYEFTKVAIQIDEHYIEIAHTDFEEIGELREQIERAAKLRQMLPSRVVSKLFTHPLFIDAMHDKSTAYKVSTIAMIARDLEIPSAMLARILRDMPQGDLFHYPPSIEAMMNVLRVAGEYQVLYLPTYRRIEQDLKAIFPDMEERQLRELTARGRTGQWPSKRAHLELVHFGMQDVEGKIADELKGISENARSQLSNLTGSYLRDVIRNTATSVDFKTINSLEPHTVRAVLRRVEENTLDSNDKNEVEAAIERVKSAGENTAERDKYLAHFFSRLLGIYKNLSESERSIRRLVELCNKYLEGKQLDYNDNDFTAKIVDATGVSISWRSLSSGEKQVASLFTHLFLSKEQSQLILIDEPELSLSVPWQKTLLPDIAASGNCSFLLAVTHSPFIYANELDRYAVDLAQCIKAA